MNNIKDRYGTLWLKGTYETIPTHKLSFETLKNAILNGEIGKVKEKYYFIKKYKEEGTHTKTVKEYKASLPYVNMQGIYQKRANTGIIENTFTWVVPWDIDKKENKNKNFDELWKKLCDTPSVILCARTSGGGIRGYSRLLENAFTFKVEEFQPLMKNVIHPYLLGLWDVILDTHQYTLSQPWYMPYDENVYWNWNAEAIENVNYSWKQKPISYYKPIYCDDLQEELIKAIESVPTGAIHYNDVLKLFSYAKSIGCSYNDVAYAIKSKISSSSILHEKGNIIMEKTFKSANEVKYTKNGVRYLIGKLGGNKKIMKYEQ